MGALGVDVGAAARRFKRYLAIIVDVLGHVGRAEAAQAYRKGLLMASDLIGGLGQVMRGGDMSALDTWLEKQCAGQGKRVCSLKGGSPKP